MFNGHWVRTKNDASAKAFMREQEEGAERRRRSADRLQSIGSRIRSGLRRIFRR